MQHSEDVGCFSINSGITRSVYRHWNMTVGVGKLDSTFLIVSLACSSNSQLGRMCIHDVDLRKAAQQKIDAIYVMGMPAGKAVDLNSLILPGSCSDRKVGH